LFKISERSEQALKKKGRDLWPLNYRELSC